MSTFNSFHDELSLQPIPTNSKELDNILGGGIRMKTITDIYGFKFKTQFCLQLTINTIIPEGLVAGEVVWISTKDTKTLIRRLQTLCENYTEMFNLKLNLQNLIHFHQAHNVSQLISCVYDIKKFIKHNKKVSLIHTFRNFPNDQHLDIISDTTDSDRFICIDNAKC